MAEDNNLSHRSIEPLSFKSVATASLDRSPQLSEHAVTEDTITKDATLSEDTNTLSDESISDSGLVGRWMGRLSGRRLFELDTMIILDYMYVKNQLTLSEIESIRLLGPRNKLIVNKRFLALLLTKPANAFECFIDALEDSGQTNMCKFCIYFMIQDSAAKLSVTRRDEHVVDSKFDCASTEQEDTKSIMSNEATRRITMQRTMAAWRKQYDRLCLVTKDKGCINQNLCHVAERGIRPIYRLRPPDDDFFHSRPKLGIIWFGISDPVIRASPSRPNDNLPKPHGGGGNGGGNNGNGADGGRGGEANEGQGTSCIVMKR